MKAEQEQKKQDSAIKRNTEIVQKKPEVLIHEAPKEVVKKEEVRVEKAKIENVSFHNPRNRQEEHRPFDVAQVRQEKPQRKEINLSDLKKALEESLAKREDPKSVPVEKEEDFVFGGAMGTPVSDDKKSIKPGEKVNL